jgi:hypothetical protein
MGGFIEVGYPGGTLIHNNPLENPEKIHGGVGLSHYRTRIIPLLSSMKPGHNHRICFAAVSVRFFRIRIQLSNRLYWDATVTQELIATSFLLDLIHEC